MNIFIFMLASFTITLVDAGDDDNVDVKKLAVGVGGGALSGAVDNMTGKKKKDAETFDEVAKQAAAETAEETILGTDGKDPTVGQAGAQKAAEKLHMKGPASKGFEMVGHGADKVVGKAAQDKVAGKAIHGAVNGGAYGGAGSGLDKVALKFAG